MKVRDLIEELSELDSEAQVILDIAGYEQLANLSDVVWDSHRDVAVLEGF